MNWIVVKRLPLDQDIAPLAKLLTARGFIYRVIEEQGQQVLSVQDPHLVEPLQQLIDQFLMGKIDLPTVGIPQNRPQQGIPFHATPVTLILIILSALGALLVETEMGQQWALWFTFQATNEQHRFVSLADTLTTGQWWRLLTPAFLHFGLFHVLFNSLWMWDLGRRVELALGKYNYLLLFATTAIVANLTQYFWNNDALFGGMSGVVYALVGFIWLRRQLTPQPLYAVPLSIIGFMLVWLLLCMSGFVDNFIDGSVANAAHVGGLFSGMLLGAVTGLYSRRKAV